MRVTKKPAYTYLYGDGHAVQVFAKNDPHVGRIEWAEIIERFGPETLFSGRLILNGGAAEFVRAAVAVGASAAAVENGSDSSKALGLPVGSVTLQGRSGSLILSLTPTILGSDIAFQPEKDEPFDPNLKEFGCLRVAKVHRVKEAAEATPDPLPIIEATV